MSLTGEQWLELTNVVLDLIKAIIAYSFHRNFERLIWELLNVFTMYIFTTYLLPNKHYSRIARLFARYNFVAPEVYTSHLIDSWFTAGSIDDFSLAAFFGLWSSAVISLEEFLPLQVSIILLIIIKAVEMYITLSL
jgi:hypothetical protein